MSKPSSSKRSRPDRAAEALLALVEALLDDFFTEPGIRKKYKSLSRGGRKAGQTVSIGSMELSDRGEVELTMNAGSPEILVAITHPRFNASITARYDLDTAMMSEAAISHIEGDSKTAAKSAEKWLEALDAEADELDDALAAFLSGDNSPFDKETDPGEPPPPSPLDKIMVDSLARSLAREMRRKKPDVIAHQDDLLELEGSPQALWPILDGMVAACTAEKRDDALIDAWQFLLENLLTLTRYRIDRAWAWAVRMADDYQQKLIEIGYAGRIAATDFARMAGALGEAGIEVKQETRVALANAGLRLPEPEQTAEPHELMQGLMDQMAAGTSNPFEVASGFGEATRVMPSEIRCFMAHEFARSSHVVLRDSVPLMLLAEEPEVRRAAAEALQQTASPGTMSPDALRRMIAVRNWVPQADRAAIDRAIREARTKGVECAVWPPAQDLMVTASMIDGSGAQSVILTSRRGRKGMLAGLLLKLGSGVADSWCDPGVSRRNIDETLAALRDTSAAAEVGRAYLDVAVQNAIAKGTIAGRPPGSTLLQIAELFDGSGWRDQRLEIVAEAKRLFDALPAERQSLAAIEASLQRSGEWIDETFAESWFLDDADVRAIVGRVPRRDTAQAVRRLMQEAMPQRRAEWAERFLLLALRALAAADQAQTLNADDLIVLTHSLCGERDLASVPLMTAIAARTIEVARIARW